MEGHRAHLPELSASSLIVTTTPLPTPIYRLIHADNLPLLLQRGGMHAPNHTPNDGLVYRTIHNVSVQQSRHGKQVSCGPGGTIHDYVPFYFGVMSVMLLQLKTNYVDGYREGQEPLIYLKSTAQRVATAGLPFVFTDGHGLAAFTSWFQDLAELGHVPWETVNRQYWKDTKEEPDRKRRKQAEFLIHQVCPWALIEEIGVYSAAMKTQVETALTQHGQGPYPSVQVRRSWYYP